MDSALTTELHSALDLTVPDDVVRRLHNIIRRELRSADSTAQIQSTGYFNHSWIPDFELSWPTSGRSRSVFVRFSTENPTIDEDLDRLGSRHPLFWGLFDEPTSRVENPPRKPRVPSSEDNALLTNAAAVRALKPQAEPFAREVLPSTVLQSGQGNVDEPVAAMISRSAEEGFRAAAEVDSVGVLHAFEKLGRFIGAAGRRDLGGYLRVVWESSGGAPTVFPTSVSAELSPEGIRPLLKALLFGSDVRDDDFWFKLGGRVSLADLESVQSSRPRPNLQRLLTACTDVTVSAAQLTSHEPKLREMPEIPFVWQIVDGHLEITSDQWTLRFSDDGRTFAHSSSAGLGIDWRSLVDRASAGVWRVKSARVERRDERTTVEVKSGSLASGDGHRLMEIVGNEPDDQGLIVEVEVDGRGLGQAVALDFERGVARRASGAGTARVPLGPMTLASVGLLAGVSPEEIAEVLPADRAPRKVEGQTELIESEQTNRPLEDI